MNLKIKTIDGITIKQFVKIMNIYELYPEGISQDIKIISTITNITEEELIKYDIKSIEIFKKLINDVLVNEPNKNDFKPFKLKGVKYIFDKNLDKMSTGMFVDLENFSKNLIQNIHIITAILFRPIKNFKYNPDDVMERAMLFNDHLSISKAFSAGFFLSILKKNYLKSTQVFLESQEKLLTEKKTL